MNLKGKTAVVTGSTSGIGLGMAKGLAAEGVNIVLNGLGDDDAVQAAVSEVEALGVQVHFNGADMTKPDQIEGLIGEAKDTFGGVDILVNNAGIQHVAPVEDFPPEKWDAIIGIILSSSFHTIRHTVPLMREAGWGRIINLASAHALVASPFKSAYVAAKHGVLGLTKVIALEVAQDNITCNAICPGYVNTALAQGQLDDTAKARNITRDEALNVLLTAQHTKKFVEIEDIANLAVFLCSDAAQNITGTHQTIDGGWSAA